MTHLVAEKRKHLGRRLKDPRKQRTFGELLEWFLELPPVKAKKSKRERVISPEEYQNLLRAIAPHAANLAKVLYWTATRYSEVVRLIWDRVDMKRGLIHH